MEVTQHRKSSLSKVLKEYRDAKLMVELCQTFITTVFIITIIITLILMPKEEYDKYADRYRLL
jgi:hypothetical protein